MFALWCSALVVAAPSLIASSDMEEGDGGLISSGDTMQWQWGDVLHGPGGGVDGNRAWSTRLSGDTFNDSTDRLDVPIPALDGLISPMLRFSSWYSFGSGDSGWIELDEGDGWKRIAPVYGYPEGENLSGTAFEGNSGGWQTVVVDLRGMEALPQAPKLRLVFASDLSGGGPGWTVDNFQLWEGDIAAPQISALSAPGDTEDLTGPYAVLARVSDDQRLIGVTLVWSAEDAAGQQVDSGSAAMTQPGGPDGPWEGQIPAQPPDTTVRAGVEASDGINLTRLDAPAFRVYLAAPPSLDCPAERVVWTEATLSWAAPQSAHPVLGYAIYRDGALLAEAAGTEAEVALTGDHAFIVRARYRIEAGPRAGETLEGDASPGCAVHALIPSVDGLDPAEGWPGDQLRLSLQGRWLLMAEGEADASLGEGIGVAQTEVRDVDRAWLEVAIDPEAAAGPRALHLALPQGTLTLPGAFTVRDPGDRPRLLSSAPARLTQGESAWLEIAMVGAPLGAPSVDLGEGVVAAQVEVEEGVLRVLAMAGPSAPLGVREILVDDGVRIFEGATLEIRDQPVPVQRVCGVAGGAGGAAGGAGGLAGIAAVLLIRRRARAPC